MSCGRIACGMQTSGFCYQPNCVHNPPGWYGPTYNPLSYTPPMGCICPPTSEQTCRNELCPRKSRLTDQQKDETP